MLRRRVVPILAFVAGCSRPAPHADASREPLPPSSAARRADVTLQSETTPEEAPRATSASAPEETTAPSECAAPALPESALEPALRDASGEPLPQTDEKPRTDSPFFQQQARKLFDAIVANDPELTLSFFFPVVAYEQVKDIKNPARDWEYRLIAAFRRQVREYHRLLGKRRAETRFLRLEVPEERAEWMKPGREGNRIGYYRVLRSRLFYADADGKERSLEVTSLISWRGEWYLVHLHGFE
jgi:hypothetical protein